MHIFLVIIFTLLVIGCIASIIPYIKFVIKCLKQEKYYEIIDYDGLTKLVWAFFGTVILYLIFDLIIL